LGWVPQNVTVIPHGAEVLEAGGVPDAVELKKAYGLQGKDVVMCLGWWEEYKRFEDVVEIWPQVVRNVPDAALVIAGDARPGSRGGVRYKPTLLKAVDDSPAKDIIIVIQGSFHPKEYWLTHFRSVSLPSSQTLGVCGRKLRRAAEGSSFRGETWSSLRGTSCCCSLTDKLGNDMRNGRWRT
jgi:glycosyltransferase involved in cell wall biosynthesis